MWMGKIMDSAIHAWARCFRNEGQGGRLEGAQRPFQLTSCERADVTPCHELTIDNATIYICKGFDRWMIRGSISFLDLWYSHIETS